MKGKKTGGRKVGTPNRATADVRALAQQYAPDAIATLFNIANDGEQQASARVAACKEILDRGYGKSQEPTRMDFYSNLPMRSLTDDQLNELASGRTPLIPPLQIVFVDGDEADEATQ